jgi:hypothetical protein
MINGNKTTTTKTPHGALRRRTQWGDDNTTTGSNVQADMDHKAGMLTSATNGTVTGSNSGNQNAHAASRRAGCFGSSMSLKAAALGRSAAPTTSIDTMT